MPGRRRRRLAVLAALLALAATGVAGCASAPPPDPGGPGFLDAATGVSPREDGVATATLPDTVAGANLLVAVATGDGPDNPATQRSVVTDSAHHTWTLAVHHVVFGSILDVWTAPATGAEAGARVSSDLTVERGDEGHAVTVLAYRHGRLGAPVERNGSFGTAQQTHDVPAGADVVTAFGDGRQKAEPTPAPGYRSLLAHGVEGPPGIGDQDLYAVSHLDAPWRGGPLLSGNLAPPPSGYWGLVSVPVLPL